LTYIDANGNWHRVSKGAPEQVKSYYLGIRGDASNPFLLEF